MIVLREFRDSDRETIAALLNNEQVARYLSSKIPFPYSLDDARWFIETGSKDGINKVIEYDGFLAGVIGVSPGQFEYQCSGELGYWIGESYWGRGIATMAVSQITELVFSSTEIVRLFAPVFAPNKASMRVLEKNGYYCEAVFKDALYKHGTLYNAHIFAKIKP